MTTRGAFVLLLSLASACDLSAATQTPVQIWGRQLGTAAEDFAGALAVDAAGNCHLAGATAGDLAGKNAGKGDLVVGKFDAAGQSLGLRQFGTAANDGARSIALDPAGNVHVTGGTRGKLGSTQFGKTDGFVAKLDPLGQILWLEHFGTERWDGIHGLAFSPDGASRGLVGGCQNYDQCQAFLREFDADGRELWQTKVATDQTMCGTQVAIDGHGAIYQVGGTHGPAFGAYIGTGNDIFLVKLSAEDPPAKP